MVILAAVSPLFSYVSGQVRSPLQTRQNIASIYLDPDGK